MWDLVWRLGGQVRVSDGVVLGFDLVAALALAEVLGVQPLAVAEFLPFIEAAMVRKTAEASEKSGGGGEVLGDVDE